MTNHYMTKKGGKLLLVIFNLLLWQLFCNGQQFLNLDFESIDQDNHQPRNWFIIDENNCNFSIDSISRLNGKYSYLLTPKKEGPESYALLLNELNKLVFNKKKKITLSAFFKIHGHGKYHISLVCRQLSESGKEVDNLYTTATEDSGYSDGWRRINFGSPIDSSTQFMAFGIKLNFNDSVWLDKFNVTLDGIGVMDLPPPSVDEPTSTDKEWLHKNIHSLTELDDTLNFHQTNDLFGGFQSERIIGLGEVTHGSHEVYVIKDKLLQHLFGKMDFSILAMEMDAYDAGKLNACIAGNDSDPRSILAKTGYWPWRTEEFLHLLQWMKEYNRNHDKKICIRGFDIPFSPVAQSNIRNFSNAYAKTLLPYIDSINELYAPETTTKDLRECRSLVRRATELESCFNGMVKDLETKCDKQELEAAKLAIRNIVQYAVFQYGEQDQDIFRDQCMADNLIRILEKHPRDKIVIWAHNAHIGKSGYSMGSLIKKQYPFYSIGFLLGGGSFNATDEGSTFRSIAPCRLSTALTNSYESFFINSAPPEWFLNMKNTLMPDSWLIKDHLFRFSGSACSKYQFSQTNIIKDFDGVIFIKKSTPSHLIN